MALSGSFQTNKTTAVGSGYPSFVIVEWSAKQNIINNMSTISWTCKGGSDGSSTTAWTTTGPVTVAINGVKVLEKTDRFQMKKGTVIGSGSLTVSHDSDGTKSVAVSISAAVYTSAVNCSHSGTITLNKIDRAAPSVTISTSGITESAVTVSASASTTCDIWEYSTDNGSSWTQFSTTAGTSAKKTITGLSPNTSYTIKVRARKKSNQVYGVSSGSVIKTLGNAILNSVTAVTADASTVSLTFNWTVYSTSFTYKLEIKNGSSVVTTITIPAQSSTGTSNKTITLTAAQRTALLNAIPSKPSFSGTFVLTTLSGSTTIGSTSSKTATVQTTKANSGPSFSNLAGFTYKDSNPVTSGVTGDDQLLVQDYSTLAVTAYAATARNGASIKTYEATINDTTVSSAGTALNLGKVSKSGDLTLTVKAVDSRGYSVEITKTITVIAYKKIDISEDTSTMRRVNEVEAITQIDFEATISKILVSSVNKNAFQVLKYRYKKTSESSYGSYVDISSEASATDMRITYENNEFVSLDPDFSYHIEFYVSDKITSDTYVITLSPGTPLISKRRKKVGINNRNPKAALDIVGGVIVDGNPLTDFVVEQGVSGIWIYRKWASGIAECWGRKSISTPVANSWGALYISGSLPESRVSFPFTFDETPIITANLTCAGTGAFLMVPGTSNTPTSDSTGAYEIARGTAINTAKSFDINYYVIGKLKEGQ